MVDLSVHPPDPASTGRPLVLEPVAATPLAAPLPADPLE
jgi:hypothetical protein